LIVSTGPKGAGPLADLDIQPDDQGRGQHDLRTRALAGLPVQTRSWVSGNLLA
jgi:hypothetical protein